MNISMKFDIQSKDVLESIDDGEHLLIKMSSAIHVFWIDQSVVEKFQFSFFYSKQFCDSYETISIILSFVDCSQSHSEIYTIIESI